MLNIDTENECNNLHNHILEEHHITVDYSNNNNKHNHNHIHTKCIFYEKNVITLHNIKFIIIKFI